MFDVDVLEHIYEKDKKGEDLTLDEIKLLYSFYDYFYSDMDKFSVTSIYDKYLDMRGEKNKYKVKRELAKFFGCEEKQISVDDEDVFKEDILCHFGSINTMRLVADEEIKFPEIVIGDVINFSVDNVSNITLPKYISGDLRMNGLSDARGLIVPEHIGGNFILPALKSLDTLQIPDYLGGYLAVSRDIKGTVLKEGFDISRMCDPSDLPTISNDQLNNLIGNIKL